MISKRKSTKRYQMRQVARSDQVIPFEQSNAFPTSMASMVGHKRHIRASAVHFPWADRRWRPRKSSKQGGKDKS